MQRKIEEYPFSQDAASDLLEIYNVDAYEMYDRHPFSQIRVLRKGMVTTADYVVDRVNILSTSDNRIVDIYRG